MPSPICAERGERAGLRQRLPDPDLVAVDTLDGPSHPDIRRGRARSLRRPRRRLRQREFLTAAGVLGLRWCRTSVVGGVGVGRRWRRRRRRWRRARRSPRSSTAAVVSSLPPSSSTAARGEDETGDHEQCQRRASIVEHSCSPSFVWYGAVCSALWCPVGRHRATAVRDRSERSGGDHGRSTSPASPMASPLSSASPSPASRRCRRAPDGCTSAAPAGTTRTNRALKWRPPATTPPGRKKVSDDQHHARG